MEYLDTREWLLTNGLGSFASGTVSDAHTRTYHGWLFAALEPPSRRHLLLAHIDATLEIGGTPARQSMELSTNFWGSRAIAPQGYRLLRSFQTEPVPTWVWGESEWRITRQIVMPYGLIAPDLEYTTQRLCNRVLVRYRYEGHEPVILKLRPLVCDRDFHHQQQASADLRFSQIVESKRLLIQARRPNGLGTSWQLEWSHGNYYPDGIWYWDYRYPEETKRGLGDREDLFNPGCLVVSLQPGDSVILEARVRTPDSIGPSPQPLDSHTFDQTILTTQHRLENQFADLISSPQDPLANLKKCLLHASDQFVVYRSSIQGPTVIAGYPWFNDWGRDTLIALPGLALATRRYTLARGLLQTFGQFCQNGLIPNAFPDEGSQPFYNCIDAALWWLETLGLYLETTQDWEFLREQYPTVQRIYKAFMVGTSHNIRVDATDGLLTWDEQGVALTWMDAVVDGKPITPRRGKPIEVNALWYSGLCWAHQWAKQLEQASAPGHSTNYGNQARGYIQQAQKVKGSLQKFWNPSRSYFFDTIEPDDRPDPKIRPNAVIALSLYHCGFDDHLARQGLRIARDRLLTPLGLRSLDPADPDYVGSYRGNVEQRDRAYHQGTVWSWLIGPFCRAWTRFYPDEPLPIDASALLHHMETQACLGSISEIFDGDAPHTPQGAIAQAWSVAEILRHWSDLTQSGSDN